MRRRPTSWTWVLAALVAAGAGSALASDEPGGEAMPATPHYERVNLRELAAAPKRFHNRPIEIARAKCLRGGPDEYRCVPSTDAGLTFILNSIRPAALRAIIDRDCTSLDETLRRASCTVSIRMVPRSELNMEVRGMERTIIGARVGILASNGVFGRE